MDHQLKRLLNLVRRTGDRLVVTDPNGEDTYVLMGLEAYEKIADRSRASDIDFSGSDDVDNFEDDFYENEDDYVKNYWDCDECDGSCETCQKYDLNNQDIEPPPTPIFSAPPTPKEDIWSAMPEAGSNSETWNVNNFDEAEQKIVKEKFGEDVGANGIRPSNEPEPSLPIIEQDTNSQKPDDFGEEQFYLEPIE
jgi:hypothetical protein